jgi:hypothetical protein
LNIDTQPILLVSKKKQIGAVIIVRKLHDYLKSEPLALKAISGFKINSVSYEMLGPVFDNDYGMMYSFKIQDCLELEYDTSKWWC